jgi:antitoxin (DNA-binding transcriptional repressor) of toxin-antitoxin stability system
MKRVNALQLRQAMGKVLAALERNGEPILLEKGRKPVGVIISIRDYQERFAEKAAAEARERVIADIDSLTMSSVDPTPVVEVLREMRGES